MEKIGVAHANSKFFMIDNIQESWNAMRKIYANEDAITRGITPPYVS